MLERCAADAQQPAAALQVGDDGAPCLLGKVRGMQVNEASAGLSSIQRSCELIRSDSMNGVNDIGVMDGMM
ncbi:hypothetical protein D3C85_1857530 [compost metagenome]